MTMTTVQTAITLGVVALGTILTRFLPYLLFPEGKEVPPFIDFLGKVLGPAIFGLLVVYCLRNVDWTTSFSQGGTHGIPELIASAVTAGVFLRCRKMIVSMAAGTAVYMVLVQLVF